MMRLSIVVITKNEGQNLRRCLEAVRWADEIVVVDSGSTDNTVDIAEEFGSTVYSIVWRGFGQAKREGVAKASGDWILSLDADEVVTPELAKEIARAISEPSRVHGYSIMRRTNFLGRWLFHRKGHREYVTRLFRKGHGEFDESIVHERLVVDGVTEKLSGELLHYSFPTLESYLQKQDRYTSLGAQVAFQHGGKGSWFDVMLRPPATFVKYYVSRQGFRDGWEGLLFSTLSAVMVMVKYAKVRQLVRSKERVKSE